MIRRAQRGGPGKASPHAPAPVITLVELTFKKQQVEHWIRFGRKSYERILDRRRSLVDFEPGSIFAFTRWAANEHCRP